MMNHADQFGREGTPTWTTAYRNLLLAPAPAGGRSFSELTGDVLNAVVANSIAVNQPLKLVWHTFEIPRWRPATMTSADPRRSWWNIVAPVPGPVTSTPFTSSGFGDNVFELIELGFLVDQLGIITVMAQTLTEAAAILGLDKTQIEAAWDAPP
jgi:hypothetical protein